MIFTILYGFFVCELFKRGRSTELNRYRWHL